ncbi:MAG: iron-regulated protein [Myxococcaceae bacterium]|nr:iron-regulated protein [Myxococcaceae bacterium]
MRASFPVVLVVVVAACGPGQPAADGRAEVVAQYAALVHTRYEDAVSQATALEAKVKAFVQAPGAQTLEDAKQAWLSARPSYLRTEAFRFYGGPIDDEVNNYEGQINSWPLDENFIDYVQGEPAAGLVNNPSMMPSITIDAMSAHNQKDKETQVSTGWHAIEFLLWGQDLSDTGPGARPFSDYVTGQGATAANQDRRRQYLALVTTKLVADLEAVEHQWDLDDPKSYGAAFVADDPQKSLEKIFTGLGQLSFTELGGERMAAAYKSKDQEDEHSCFSDNTHWDFVYDQVGIVEAYKGIIDGKDGPGLDGLLKAKNKKLYDALEAQLAATTQAYDAIPQPFDQALKGDDASPGRVAMKASLDAVRAQGESFAVGATELGLTISLQ